MGTPKPFNKETKPNWPPNADGLFIRFRFMAKHPKLRHNQQGYRTLGERAAPGRSRGMHMQGGRESQYPKCTPFFKCFGRLHPHYSPKAGPQSRQIHFLDSLSEKGFIQYVFGQPELATVNPCAGSTHRREQIKQVCPKTPLKRLGIAQPGLCRVLTNAA